jgi:HEAT repeat protein
MALKKATQQDVIEREKFDNLDEAVEFFENSTELEDKSYALNQMALFEGGYQKIAEILQHEEDHSLIDIIGAILSKVDGEVAPIDEILTLLKRENPYVRNLAISVLQDYGDAIKYYIVKYLIGDDRDLRIFAINVLGDVKFASSRDMLVELLESEEDVNVAMTAVDYLGEIGQEEDIALLESLKERFSDEFYVSFAVDGAINAIKG